MGFEFDPNQGKKPVFWLRQKPLKDRLALMLPGVRMDEVEVETAELSGNASFVNYVRMHRLTHVPSGDVVQMVEKSIRKVAFISSLEARFYRERAVLDGCKHFHHPRCFGLIETPWESLIFSRYVTSLAPRMHAIGEPMAMGISELESRSFDYLHDAPPSARLQHWEMDFFRVWYLVRPRFNFARFFRNLRVLAVEDDSFSGFEAKLRHFVPTLRVMARDARQSPRCFCHMDYLRKNLFASRKGLQVIDWSEVKVGRVGFDGGAYLSALFRRNDMALYATVRDDFLGAYESALDPRFDKGMAMANVRYVFLLNSLWHCMRPETIAEFRDQGRLPLLREKLEYLLTLQ